MSGDDLPDWARERMAELEESGYVPTVTRVLKAAVYVGLPLAALHPVGAALSRLVRIIRGVGSMGKPWYKSKTIGTAIGAIAALLAIWGIDIPVELQQQLTELIALGVPVIMAILRLITGEPIKGVE